MHVSSFLGLYIVSPNVSQPYLFVSGRYARKSALHLPVEPLSYALLTMAPKEDSSRFAKEQEDAIAVIVFRMRPICGKADGKMQRDSQFWDRVAEEVCACMPPIIDDLRTRGKSFKPMERITAGILKAMWKRWCARYRQLKTKHQVCSLQTVRTVHKYSRADLHWSACSMDSSPQLWCTVGLQDCSAV